MKESFDERFSVYLTSEDAEWVRDYRYSKIKATGDIDITFRDVFEDALNCLKKTTPVTVTPRPDLVKANEKIKRERQLQRKNKTLATKKQ